MSMLQNNTITLNNVFDSQLLPQIGDQKIGEDIIKDNSYLDYIDREFGPFSKGKREDMIKKIENIQPTKKAKLYYSPSSLSKKSTYYKDEISSLELKII